MNINGIGNKTAVNWDSLLNKIGTVEKTTTPEGKESVTITLNTDAGVKTLAIGAPADLELPGTVDQTAIDSLCAKLTASKDSLNLSDADISALYKALTEALAGVDVSVSPKSKTVMFDLYKLMALLVEVAQKQRDAAREIRHSESMQVQKSIMDQAAQQRTAAITGIVASAICCAVQVGVTAYFIGKETMAHKQQLSSLESSGINNARQGVDMLKNADTAQSAQNQLNDVRSKVGGQVASNVEQGFANSTVAEQKLATAKAQDMADAQKLARVQNFNQPLNDADIPQGSKLYEAKANYDAFKELKQEMNDLDAMDPNTRTFQQTQRLMELKTNITDLQEAQFKNAYETERQAYANELSGKVSGQNIQKIDAARTEYRAAVKNDLARYEDEYENALSARSLLGDDAPAGKIAAADAKVEATAKNLQFARAYAYRELAQDGITTPHERAIDVKSANDRLEVAQTGRQFDTKFLDAQRSINKYEGYINITTAVGNVLQNIVQNTGTLIQAKATEKGAEQKKAEEELDQMKDLFAQAQQLINQTVQLMNAVTAAETQSMRDAIQA